MVTVTTIIIVIAIIAYILLSILSKSFKKVSRVISIISAVIFLVFAVFAVVLYKDASEFAQQFPISENVFIFNNKGDISTGVYINLQNQKDLWQGVTPLTSSQVDEINDQYTSLDYQSILNDKYKLFIIQRELFEEHLSDPMKFNEINYTKQEVIDIITKENGFDIFFNKFFEESGFPENVDKQLVKTKFLEQMQFNSEEDIRSFMFLLGFFGGIMNKEDDPQMNSIALLEHIKSGNIIIYPETITFKTLRFIPLNALKKVMQRIPSK